MLYEDNDYLVHYGIKGQHWGIRRFQNEDGSLTPEGQRQRAEYYDQYRSHDFKRGTDAIRSVGNSQRRQITPSNITKSKPKKGTPAQEKARKDRAKKILIAAGAVTLAAAGAYALHRREKATANLMEIAKNKVHAEYTPKDTRFLTAKEQENLAVKRVKEMAKIRGRRSARKALHMTRKDASRYIKNNKLASQNMADIIEKRLGPIGIEKGFTKSKITGKLKPLSKHTIEKSRKLAARNIHAIGRI